MKKPRGTPRLRLSRTLRSRLRDVDAVCLEIQAALRKQRLGSRSFALELMARECLNNAVLHGNRADPKRRVELDLSCAQKWICLRVSDEGSGFNWRRHRKRAVSSRGTTNATDGRGMAILAAYADRVRFNRGGNQVTLWLGKATQNSENRNE